jgi:hypothetical protein
MMTAHDQNKQKKNSQAGFVAAEFLFSFVLVISCGIIVFALTFSLMTVEVAQYITWSAARSYSAGNKSKDDNRASGQRKFANLMKQFPLLTGESGEWFKLTVAGAGVNSGSQSGMTIPDPTNRLDGQTRHPWGGFSTNLELKLFKSLNIPFLGPITNDESLFKFPLHAFILRHPSQTECIEFYEKRFDKIKDLINVNGSSPSSYSANEDNGC